MRANYNFIRIDFDFINGRWFHISKIINNDLSKYNQFVFYFKGKGSFNNFQIKIENDNGTSYGFDYEKLLNVKYRKNIF